MACSYSGGVWSAALIRLRNMNLRRWFTCEYRTIKAIVVGYPLLAGAVIFAFFSVAFFAGAERFLGYERLRRLNLHEWNDFGNSPDL